MTTNAYCWYTQSFNYKMQSILFAYNLTAQNMRIRPQEVSPIVGSSHCLYSATVKLSFSSRGQLGGMLQLSSVGSQLPRRKPADHLVSNISQIILINATVNDEYTQLHLC